MRDEQQNETSNNILNPTMNQMKVRGRQVSRIVVTEVCDHIGSVLVYLHTHE